MKNLKKTFTKIFAIGVLTLLIFNFSDSIGQNTSLIVPLDNNGITRYYDTVCTPPLTIGVIPPCGGGNTQVYTVSQIPYQPYSYVGTDVFSFSCDDDYSDVLPIGFTFCFYNNSFTECLGTSNGAVSFDIVNANGGFAWSITQAVPGNAQVLNCVMGPWEDLETYTMNNYLPALQYATYGVAPFRRFVFSVNNEAYYSCNADNFKGQIILYESANYIDILIDHKDLCSGWNGGYAIEGLESSTGDSAITVPGRNYPANWSVTTQEGYRFCPDNPPPTLTWTGPNIIGSNIGDSIVVGSSGNYIVTLHYACNNTDAIDTFSIYLKDSITTITAAPDSCGNHVGAIWVAPGGTAPFTYAWTPSGQTGQTASNLPSGFYTVTVTDANGCWVADTITVDSVSSVSAVGTVIQNVSCFGLSNGSIYVTPTGVGPFNYAWTPSGQTTQTVSNIPAGVYTCTVVNPNNMTCQAHVILTVTQPPELTVTAGAYSPAFCSYILTGTDTADINGGTAPFTYTWSNGTSNPIDTGLITGTYGVTVTDANGCTAISSSAISIPSYLAIITGPNDSLCQGDSALISVTVTGGYTPYNYIWNTFGPIGNPAYVKPQITTNYIVTITDAEGCTIASSPINVAVHATPNPLFTAFPTNGCTPLVVQFINHSTCTDTIVSWRWNFGDFNTPSDSSSPHHIYTTPGLYNVSMVVTSSSGCSATITDSAYIDAFPVPISRFIMDPTITSLLAPEITFTDRSQGADTVFYEFGDGATSNMRNTYHSYTDTGSYWVIQSVYNQYGCADTSTSNVIITPYYTFYIPNTFTPNGNGINDFFQPYGTGISDYSISIFDRWGAVIFSSNSIENPWDGTYNGYKVPDGTYIYDIKIKDNTQTAHEFFGKVTLLR